MTFHFSKSIAAHIILRMWPCVEYIQAIAQSVRLHLIWHVFATWTHSVECVKSQNWALNIITLNIHNAGVHRRKHTWIHKLSSQVKLSGWGITVADDHCDKLLGSLGSRIVLMRHCPHTVEWLLMEEFPTYLFHLPGNTSLLLFQCLLWGFIKSRMCEAETSIHATHLGIGVKHGY